MVETKEDGTTCLDIAATGTDFVVAPLGLDVFHFLSTDGWYGGEFLPHRNPYWVVTVGGDESQKCSARCQA